MIHLDLMERKIFQSKYWSSESLKNHYNIVNQVKLNPSNCDLLLSSDMDGKYNIYCNFYKNYFMEK
jgi:hypothetical protein